MSWSFRAVGTPEKIVAAIEEQSQNETGQSKIEFDAAKDHLIGLVKQNFVNPTSNIQPPIMMIDADGSGFANGPENQLSRTCNVKLERVLGSVLI